MKNSKGKGKFLLQNNTTISECIYFRREGINHRRVWTLQPKKGTAAYGSWW